MQVVFRGDLNGVPVEPVALIKPRIFCGDPGVLKIRRYLAEWNKLVPFVIRRMPQPRLDVAFHMDRCGGRVDPARSYE